MPWRGYTRSFCKGCGRPREEGETFSARGKCEDCGDGHMLANAAQLRAHSGPWFHHWRRRNVAALGGVLLDERSDES